MQLVAGLALLNATPFWTVFNSRRFSGSGTVPVPPFVSNFINQRIFARIAAPSSVQSLLSEVRMPLAAWQPGDRC